ncbi:ABC transporter ATP-binding protein [Micromonospora sp. NPDC127501]|uniref:ABC transporter ATP-binding protein n=1 Tax=Micromonospora sp. NPDC127501 TaxID=3154872 RepID=UPI00331C993B
MTLARADQASRRYGDVLALDRVDLEVRAGELVGLLGPNGAGKSTLMNLLVGLRRPSSGRVELFGGDPRDPASRRQIGVTPQETGLPGTLRVGEVVDFVSAHYPDPVPRAELLDRFGLADLARRQTGGLSGGQRRRLAVALAFVGRPRLVLLDEPTTGLDVAARHTLWEAIRAFHEDGGTVLLSSHYLEEVEALAHRVVVIGQGRVLADDTVDAVRGIVGVRRVSLVADDLPDLPGVVRSERVDGRLHLLTTDADELVRALVTAQTPFTELEVRPTSLEEAFLAITSGNVTGGAATTGDVPAGADRPTTAAAGGGRPTTV